jgi:predicted AlkP superfamily phosphohydrolase/phosphomutase
MRMNDYSGVYDMIENQCSDTNRFGLKNGSYYKHTHKLYHTLCVKHEEKLLAEAQERFDKHFKTNGEKIEAMNLLMTKKNAIPILCLL